MIRIFTTILATVALTFASNLLALAQESKKPLLQDLFFTKLVYTQQQGEVQISFTPKFTNSYKSITTPLSIEYGIKNNWQIEVEYNDSLGKSTTEHIDNEEGRSLEIATQYSFLHLANSHYHAALSFTFSLPLSRLADNKQSVEYQPSFSLARDFPSIHNMQLFTQLATHLRQTRKLEQPLAKRQKRNEAPVGSNEWIWNSGYFIPIKQLRLTTELSYVKSKEREIYLTPGIVWSPHKDWEFGVGIPLGLNNQSNKYGVMINLSYEFSLKNNH
jgi:hypothetical protein